MTINAITKEDKLKLILEFVKKYKFTVKEISDFTGKTRSQIHNIITGATTNPQNSTLNAMIDFLEAKMVGMALPDHPNYRPDVISEPSSAYNKPEATTDLMTEFVKLSNENMKLLQQMREDIIVIQKLKMLLEKHGIDYSHITKP